MQSFQRYWRFIYASATVIASLGWGVSIIGLFADQQGGAELLSGLAGRPVELSPPQHYWLQMTAIAYGAIGLLFALSLSRRFGALYLALGWFNLVCGLLLWLVGGDGRVSDTLWLSDVGFGLTTGAIILIFGRWWHHREPAAGNGA
mgnify:CR=1 FL=1